MYGRNRNQFSGVYEAWASAVHPDDRAHAEAEIQAAVKGWRSYQPRFRVIWPDGSIHHLQARSHTPYGADGKALRMIGVNYDITDQVEREREIEQQRQLLVATLDSLVDPQLFLTLEGDLRIAEVNPAAADCFGRSSNQLIGKPLGVVLPADRNSPLLHALAAVAGGGQPLIRDEQPLLLTGALEPLYADLRAVAVRGGVALSFRDVSERRQASQRLAASEQRFRLLAENVTDVVFLCERGRLSWIAPGLNRALGWRPDDWLGQRLQQLCHPLDQPRLTGQVDLVEQGERINMRVRVQDSEGRWRWLEIHAGPYCSAEGQQLGVVGALQVVDEVVEAEAELHRRARIDSLTGLLNRQEILERLDWLNQRRRQGDKALAVLFCDVDHFKEINDRHGHGGGDTVLQALAGQLRACTRAEDLVGRLGGDELLVVLQGMPSLGSAEGHAAKIHTAVQKPLALPTGVVVPTLSIGVTLLQPEESVDAVVDRADQAMYEGKLLGRNRVIAFA
ncbi:MAG: diguanylate cyclase [Cyanobacteriota bacterium]|nr:diguanylate cyclase [Cyanobacteriota bacterium]